MTALPRLKLGTAALQAQAGHPTAVGAIRSPSDLRPGVEVWVYFRGWRPGRVQRVILRDPTKARHGKARGDVAVVAILEARASNLTVRRPVREVVPAVDDQPPDGQDRKAAQEFARGWWAEHEWGLIS